MTYVREQESSNPIPLTILAIAVGLFMLPVPVLDFVYDIAALILVGFRWRSYLSTGRTVAVSVSRPAPAASVIDHAAEFEGGVSAYKEGDYKRAFKTFAKLAKRHNHAGAMNLMGLMYWKGEYAAPDLKNASRWLEKAISHGDRECAPTNLNDLAVAFAEGRRGALKDPMEAMRLLSIAAQAGLATAQYNLARGYQVGLGVSQDKAQARYWYGKAAAQGHAEAQKALREEGAAPPARNGRMTRAQALEMLDLKEGATKAEIKAAYMRLMQQVHPDKGGSTFFAKQLNEARDLLFK